MINANHAFNENAPYLNHFPDNAVLEALLARAAEKDVQAFEQLYCSTKQTVYAFVLAILKNHEDALDVLQDTYVKIFVSARLYQPMGKPMAWIFTIARNLCMSRLRTQRRNDEPLLEMENDLAFSYVSDPGNKLVLQTALKVLKEQERVIILLHAVAGMKHREIAKNLDLPLATVLSKYHRGLKKLKNYLNDQEEAQ